MRGRSTGGEERPAVEDRHVGPTARGELVGQRGADDACADDDDLVVRLRAGCTGTVRAVLGALGMALLLLLVFFDWNWFKGPLERAVSSATGREFRIDGNTATVRTEITNTSGSDSYYQLDMTNQINTSTPTGIFPAMKTT